MKSVSTWWLAAMAARVVFAQQCTNPPSTTDQFYYEAKAPNSASVMYGALIGQCSGPGGNSIAGTSMTYSDGGVSIDCMTPSSSNNEAGVQFDAVTLNGGAFSASTVCATSGDPCPPAYLLHETSTDAWMEYQNGAGNQTFSNCIGLCFGDKLSACYQGCLSTFQCGYGADFSGANLTCPYKALVVDTKDCHNMSTGLIFNFNLDCCCSAQMGALETIDNVECTYDCNGVCQPLGPGGGDDPCAGKSDKCEAEACYASYDDGYEWTNCDYATCRDEVVPECSANGPQIGGNSSSSSRRKIETSGRPAIRRSGAPARRAPKPSSGPTQSVGAPASVRR